MRIRVIHLGLIVLVWAVVALPGLGSGGLTKSEGHRVVPAVEMLATGEWLVPHMFGQAYLRKPPGGPWVFAGMIELTGDPVLGPRLASAGAFLLLGLGSWWFSRRWFGNAAGLAAGVATLLTPMLWNPARSAELESVNNLFAALGAWTVVELATKRACKPTLATLALAGFVAAQMLVKGPAGLPAVLGLLIGAAWAGRSWKVLLTWRAWLGAAIGAGVFAVVWAAIESKVRASGVTPVRQSPADFMFEPERLLDLAAFLPMVFLGALPASLAFLFPWGPDARAEADEHGGEARRRLAMARTLTLGALAGALVLMLSGVSNPRYAQPVVATTGPLMGWLVSNLWIGGTFRAHRVKIARWMLLGGPVGLAGLLLGGAVVFSQVIQAGSRATSGEAGGRAAASAVVAALGPDHDGPVVFLADGVIEARPETLLAFRDEAARLGLDAQIRWTPGLAGITRFDTEGDGRVWLVLRDDALGDEAGSFPRWKNVHSVSVHKFVFVWVRSGNGDS